MAIPNGVIFIWTGTNASIPSGWQRVTDMDNRFPKVHDNGSTNPNVTGGASTHTHTSPSHTHTLSDHIHNVDVYAGSGGGLANQESGDGNTWINHTHPTGSSGNTTSASVSSVAVTYGSVSNNPPYATVIYITPSTAVGGLANGVVCLSDDTSFVNNTGKYKGYYHSNSNAFFNLDLRDRYLLGASTGADAGSFGGSTQNIHSIDHSHTQSHSHSVANISTTTSESFGYDLNTPYQTINTNHTHQVTFNANTDSVSSSISITCDETVEPAFVRLLAIQNFTGTPYTPVGVIGMWLGDLSNIPGNFELISSYYGKHIKITDNTANIGQTGGSNTHTHSAKSHSHSISHTHTGSISGHSASLDDTGSGRTAATTATTHSIGIYSNTVTLQSSNTTADSSNNEPNYRTVALIRYKGEKGGAFLFNLLR